jgi:hypothetical protein
MIRFLKSLVTKKQEFDYQEFSSSCCREMEKLQAQFIEAYDINSYPRWDYNHSTRLLTFSDLGKEINFRYVMVGGYSTMSNTWLWAWANSQFSAAARNKLLPVKSLGEAHRIENLATGNVACTIEDAWHFTGIACKIIGGIGAYRPAIEHYFPFFVVQEFVNSETAAIMKSKLVECRNHEKNRRAFVCQHLTKGTKLGFNEAFETEEGMDLGEDDDFQAWCDECEEARLQEGEWNDVSEGIAQITCICEACYFDSKERNLLH